MFPLPCYWLLFWLTFPFFLGMLRSGEMSGNIGGLIRWPAALMMPVVLLGGIYSGVFTPTEAAAVGRSGSRFMSSPSGTRAD